MNKVADQNDMLSSEIYNEISELIKVTKGRIHIALNSEMMFLYWQIGRTIRSEILKNQKPEYGAEVVDNLSSQLTQAHGKGYRRRNLFNMISFYDSFPKIEIVQTLSAQLSWSHMLEILRIEDEVKRNFYIAMVSNERWSVRTLRERVNSMLYERTAISKLPDETIKADISLLSESNVMTSEMFFRDPYVLDFLELQDTFSEKDLENAILLELEKFMLEFGRDFTFVGRQIRITIGNRDYYIDLLFYHRKLRRLVLIELKLGEFQAEHKGQVELYLRWLDKYEKNPGEDTPVGIILCAEKSNETVELLELDQSGIHVAQYLTQLPPKKVLEEKLHLAIQRARFKMKD